MYFDKEKAAKAVGFINSLPLDKDGYTQFTLREWQQKRIIEPIFGTYNDDGQRKYTEAFVFLPKGNGKSTLIAAIATYFLFCEPRGQEIVICASKREQADPIFTTIVSMIQRQPQLKRLIAKPNRLNRSIAYPGGNGVIKVIAGDGDSSHGPSPSLIILEELHAFKNQKHLAMYEALWTASAKRKSPSCLMMTITTAGYDLGGLCHQNYTKAVKVRDGELKLDYFLPVIFEATDKDDPGSPETWAKANPALGDLVSVSELEKKWASAKDNPREEVNFKCRWLNMWLNAEQRWIDLNKWRACGVPFDEKIMEIGPDGKGPEIYCGLDFGSRDDLSGLTMVCKIDGLFYVKALTWISASQAREKVLKKGVRYDEWIKSGHMVETMDIEDNRTDYEKVISDIVGLRQKYNIQQIAVDSSRMESAVQQLSKEGFNVYPFPQNVTCLNAPTRELERLIWEGRLRHNNNPCLEWQALNCVVDTDRMEHIYIKKDESNKLGKVDNMVALVMALGRWLKEDQSNDIGIFWLD